MFIALISIMLIVLPLTESIFDNPFSTDSAVVWTNIVLAVATVLATLVTVFALVHDGHKHEEHTVDAVRDDAEASEERMAQIALKALDLYQQEHPAGGAVEPQGPLPLPTAGVVEDKP